MADTEDLIGKVLAICRALDAAGIDHAVGGAIALGFHAPPRATVEVDLNVFLEAEDARLVPEALEPLGFDVSLDLDVVRAGDWGQLWWGGTGIDLFFSHDPLHEAVRSRVLEAELGGQRIAILSAFDTVLFKTVFGRPKDEADIAALLRQQAGRDRPVPVQSVWDEAEAYMIRSSPDVRELSLRTRHALLQRAATAAGVDPPERKNRPRWRRPTPPGGRVSGSQ